MSEIGQMKWRTCFSSISYAGYKLDILKSALQKYLRRREFEKMLWCCSEIYMFHSLATTDKEKQAAKGIISNMLNNLFMIFRKLNPQKNIYCGYCGGLVSVY